MPFTGLRVDALVVDPRSFHRHGARRGQHGPLIVVAVADHQPIPALVDLTGMGIDVGGDLGQQRGREHLPGTVANDSIEQRPTDTVVLLVG